MSIATDEAEEWAQSLYVGSSHIERHDGRACAGLPAEGQSQS